MLGICSERRLLAVHRRMGGQSHQAAADSAHQRRLKNAQWIDHAGGPQVLELPVDCVETPTSGLFIGMSNHRRYIVAGIVGNGA